MGFFDDLPDAQQKPSEFFPDLPAQQRRDDRSFSYLGGLGYSALQGGMFEGADNIVGIGSEKAAQDLRIRQENFEKENPIASGVAKGVGIAGSMVATSMIPGSWLPRGAQALRWLTGAENAARAVRGGQAIPQATGALSGVRNLIGGTRGGQAGIAAAKTGALSRFGAADENPSTGEGVINRTMAAANPVGVAMDYGVGRALTPVFDYAGDVAGNYAQMCRTANTQTGSRYLADAARASGHTPQSLDDLLTSVVPQYGRGNSAIPQDDIIAGLRAWGAANDPASQVAPRQALIDSLQQSAAARGQQLSQATLERQARTIEQRFQNINPVDLQFHEGLQMTAPDGAAIDVHDLVQKAVNSRSLTPDSNANRLYGHATQRQAASGETLNQLLEQRLGPQAAGRDSIDLANDLANQIRLRTEASNSLYNPIKEDARQMPGVGDRLQRAIQQVADDLQAQYGGQTDDFARTIADRIKKFMYPDEEVVMGRMVLPDESAGGFKKVTVPETDLPGWQRTVGNTVEDKTIAVQQPSVPRYRRMPDGSLQPMMRATKPAVRTVDRPTPNLANYIGNRADLNRQIQTLDRSDPMRAALERVKNRLDDAVFGLRNETDASGALTPEAQLFQRFYDANAQRADAGRLHSAFREGRDLNLTATKGKAMETLGRTIQRAENMGGEEREMFLNGLLVQLKGRIESKSPVADLSRVFNNPRMQRLMGDFMGVNEARQFGQQIAELAMAGSTYAMRKGSPTGRIMDQSVVGKLLSTISTALSYANPVAALKAGSEYAAEAANRSTINGAAGLAGAPVRSRPDLWLAARDDVRAHLLQPQVPPAGSTAARLHRLSPFAAAGIGGQHQYNPND
jgi:hypothetical protein